MKNLAWIGLLFWSLGLVSCKKSYTCSCSEISTNSNGDTLSNRTEIVEITTMGWAAETKCSDFSSSSNSAGIRISKDCQLVTRR